jgi:hypothetical protein
LNGRKKKLKLAMVKRRKTFKFRISFGIINHLDSTQGLRSHSNSSKTSSLPDDLLCKNILMKPTYASTGNGTNMNSEG